MNEVERYQALMQDPNAVFVFGSNLAGKHGAGAAAAAFIHHGAIYGVGVGPMGRCYAIPTKDQDIQTLPISGYMSGPKGAPSILPYIEQFCLYAERHSDTTFVLTRIGCGLAGYTDEQMAPLFVGRMPHNVVIPDEWLAVWRRET